MKFFIKKIIKKGFNAFGIDIRIIPKWEKNKYLWLQRMNINTVFDIGANEGQFAREIHTILPNATICSFEPLHSCFKSLQEKMKKIKKVKTFMFALGDFNGETYMHKNEFSPSSSILEMSELHKAIFPYAENYVREKITVRRLDDVVKELNLVDDDKILIKMDVQGFEDKVILGGTNTIPKASVIIIEVSFVELYQGQVLFDGIHSLFKNLGFVYAGNLGQLVNPQNGRPIQEDSIFLKKTFKVFYRN